MSFTNSSSNFWLEDNHILHASCVDNDGNSHDSQLDLDHYIGNSDGWFAWDGVSTSPCRRFCLDRRLLRPPPSPGRPSWACVQERLPAANCPRQTFPRRHPMFSCKGAS